ncbi:MAG: SDR family NAD(P)-dependent oxidoreductase [Gammaproteobacteria bacterium]
MDMKNTVALITGASRGIGAAAAIALARAGVKVALAARTTADKPSRIPGTLDATVERIRALGGEALAVPTDVTDDEQVVAMVRTTEAHFGRVDFLVNNAGINFFQGFDIPMKRFDVMLRVNLRAPFIAVKEVLPGMVQRGFGRIVNVSSETAHAFYPGAVSYGMQKAGMDRMTRDIAHYYARHGIAANSFSIDLEVPTEGYLSNAEYVKTGEASPALAGECIAWMLRQPAAYSGVIEPMSLLIEREQLRDPAP